MHNEADEVRVPRRVLRALVDDATVTVADAERRRAVAGQPFASLRTERLRAAVLVALDRLRGAAE